MPEDASQVFDAVCSNEDAFLQAPIRADFMLRCTISLHLWLVELLRLENPGIGENACERSLVVREKAPNQKWARLPIGLYGAPEATAGKVRRDRERPGMRMDLAGILRIASFRGHEARVAAGSFSESGATIPSET